jgi:APA family basic amino acid/polyamine antiporter
VLFRSTNVGTLAAFAIICITVIYLRFARPDMKRPFNMPLPVMIVVATLGALMCVFLLMSLMAHVPTRNFFLIYLAGGFLLYFVYGLSHSKLAKGESGATS